MFCNSDQDNTSGEDKHYEDETTSRQTASGQFAPGHDASGQQLRAEATVEPADQGQYLRSRSGRHSSGQATELEGQGQRGHQGQLLQQGHNSESLVGEHNRGMQSLAAQCQRVLSRSLGDSGVNMTSLVGELSVHETPTDQSDESEISAAQHWDTHRHSTSSAALHQSSPASTYQQQHFENEPAPGHRSASFQRGEGDEARNAHDDTSEMTSPPTASASLVSAERVDDRLTDTSLAQGQVDCSSLEENERITQQRNATTASEGSPQVVNIPGKKKRRKKKKRNRKTSNSQHNALAATAEASAESRENITTQKTAVTATKPPALQNKKRGSAGETNNAVYENFEQAASTEQQRSPPHQGGARRKTSTPPPLEPATGELPFPTQATLSDDETAPRGPDHETDGSDHSTPSSDDHSDGYRTHTHDHLGATGGVPAFKHFDIDDKGEFYDDCRHLVPACDGRHRGAVLIINNIEFEDEIHPYRHGAERDSGISVLAYCDFVQVDMQSSRSQWKL